MLAAHKGVQNHPNRISQSPPPQRTHPNLRNSPTQDIPEEQTLTHARAHVRQASKQTNKQTTKQFFVALGSGHAAVNSASLRQPGGPHLPPLMLQGRSFAGSKGVSTSPGPQVHPSGVPICMGCLHATRETMNMRRVSINNDPGTKKKQTQTLAPLAFLCGSKQKETHPNSHPLVRTLQGGPALLADREICAPCFSLLSLYLSLYLSCIAPQPWRR